MKEIKLNVDKSYNLMWEVKVDELIRLCRATQEDYMNGKSDLSGTQILIHLVQKGGLKLSNMINILPAVENYNHPYELNIVDNTESSVVEKQCPLCDGKGIREFPNCTPPIKEPCPGCEGEKKYTSMKDAFGMMTPKEAKEVSENMKEHNIFDKDTAEYKYFEEENHFFHAKKVKLKYKIPMKQMVVDEHNQIWNYRVNDDEVVYYYYGQAAEDNTENPKSINEILEQRMEKIIPHLKGENIEKLCSICGGLGSVGTDFDGNQVKCLSCVNGKPHSWVSKVKLDPELGKYHNNPMGFVKPGFMEIEDKTINFGINLNDSEDEDK